MAWGIILIVLGALWLLSNLGLFSWDFWNALWLLWPLALILLGLGLLLRGYRQRVPILVGVALVGGALLLAWNARPGAQGTTEVLSIPLQGATIAEVSLRVGVGRLEVGALAAGSPNLLQGQINLLPGERLERQIERSDGVRVTLRTQGQVSGPVSRSKGWNLNLSPTPILKLNFETGVGESELKLHDLRLERLDVQSGVGQVRIELPGQGQYSARIQGGVGQIEVKLPQGVGVRLTARAGIGGVETPSDLISQGQGHYESENYATAENRIDLEVQGGIGRVQIQ